MCGRFTLRASVETIAEHLSRVLPLAEMPSPSASTWPHTADSPGPLFATLPSGCLMLAPRYNIAPSQPVIAVRWNAGGRQRDLDERRSQIFLPRWGLRPSWAGDQLMRRPLINARAETVWEKPAFRAAFRHRRCLIPADGFFEWRKDGRQSLPYYIRRRCGDGLFFFAGLWEENSPPGASDEPSCAIITTEAPNWIQALHHRMPVILRPADFATWLNPKAAPQLLRTLLEPIDGAEFEYYRVGSAVNSARFDRPECIAPIEAKQ